MRHSIRAEASALLESNGPAGLRARAVAEAAGTSTAAVYELFGDKAGLIRSLYDDGFEQLQTELEALKPSDDAASDVKALFQATRHFARKRPQLFEVMFARPFEEFEPDVDARTSGSLFSLVMDRVSRWLDDVGSSADSVDVSRVLISASRGLISDDNTGGLGTTAVSRNRRWDLTFDSLMAGIAGHTSGG